MATNTNTVLQDILIDAARKITEHYGEDVGAALVVAIQTDDGAFDHEMIGNVSPDDNRQLILRAVAHSGGVDAVIHEEVTGHPFREYEPYEGGDN